MQQCKLTIHRADAAIKRLPSKGLTEEIQRIQSPICYICGRKCPTTVQMTNGKNMPVMECEHILSVLPGSGHWFLVHSGAASSYKPEELDILSREYAWAHHLCNQEKSNYEFIKQKEFIKIGDDFEYVANDGVIDYVLGVVNNDDDTHCRYPVERDHWNDIAPMGYDRYVAGRLSDNERAAVRPNGYKWTRQVRIQGPARQEDKDLQKDAMIQYYITPLVSKINGVIRACDDKGIYLLFAKLRVLTAINNDDFTDILTEKIKLKNKSNKTGGAAQGGASPLVVMSDGNEDECDEEDEISDDDEEEKEAEEAAAVAEQLTKKQKEKEINELKNDLELYHKLSLKTPENTKVDLHKMGISFMSILKEIIPEDDEEVRLNVETEDIINNTSRYLWLGYDENVKIAGDAKTYLKSARFLNQELTTLARLFIDREIGFVKYDARAEAEMKKETAIMILVSLDGLKQSRKQFKFDQKELNKYIRSCWVLLRLVRLHRDIALSDNALINKILDNDATFLDLYNMYKKLDDGLSVAEEGGDYKSIREAIATRDVKLEKEQKARMTEILRDIHEWEAGLNKIGEEEEDDTERQLMGVNLTPEESQATSIDDLDTDIDESQEEEEERMDEVKKSNDSPVVFMWDTDESSTNIEREAMEVKVRLMTPEEEEERMDEEEGMKRMKRMREVQKEEGSKRMRRGERSKKTPFKKNKRKEVSPPSTRKRAKKPNSPNKGGGTGGGGRRKKTRQNKKQKRKISKNKKHKRKTKKSRRKKNRKQTYRKRR